MKYRTRIYYTEEQKAVMWDAIDHGRMDRSLIYRYQETSIQAFSDFSIAVIRKIS